LENIVNFDSHLKKGFFVLFALWVSKNAEFDADFEYDADFESDEKSLIHRKSCLLAFKCRNYVLFTL
jgi:hypothetical protein